MKISSSLSIQGKILKWQDISSFGKILDGAIRGVEITGAGCYHGGAVFPGYEGEFFHRCE